MKCEEGDLVFSSGRRAYANGYIVGISPELELSEGYDTGFEFGVSHDDPDRTRKKIEDARELASHMIERWMKFRDSLTPEWAEQNLD